MCQQYQSGKLLLTLTVVVGLSVLLGGCVAVKEKLAPAPGRMAPLGDAGIQPPPGSTTGLMLACGLQERSPKEAGLDPEAFWKESQLTALQEQLERRELKPLLEAMRLFGSKFVQVGFVPVVRAEAGIAWEERGGQRQAVALIKQENGTLNIYPDGREELWILLGTQAVQDLVEQLRKQSEFQALEKELSAQGRQLALTQSLGVTEAASGRGLLYLAVAEGLTVNSVVTYYRVELSVLDRGSYRLHGAPVELCAEGENSKLGFEDGALMSLVGAYEVRSSDEVRVQVVRPPRDPCLFGLGGLACLDTKAWLRKNVEELKERNQQNLLKAHNLLVELGYYGIVYAWDQSKSSQAVLAGFDQLDEAQVQSWLDLLATQPASSSQATQEPQIQQALTLLNSIDPAQLRAWLEALMNAQRDSQFDVVYNSLLSQGLDKVERAYLIALSSQNPQEARTVIQRLVQAVTVVLAQPQPPLAPPPNEYVDMLVFLATTVGVQSVQALLSLPGASQKVENFLGNWVNAYSNVNYAARQRNNGDPLAGQKAAQEFTRTLQRIIRHIASNYPAGAILGLAGCGDACKIFDGLSNYLAWMGLPGNDAYDRDPIRRVEIGVGTLTVLDNVFKGKKDAKDPFDQPWTLVGIWGGSNGEPFDPAKDKDAFLVIKIPGQGFSNLPFGLFKGDLWIVARGDDCFACGTPDRTTDIVRWIKEAINVLANQVKIGPFDLYGDRGIITYGFTNRSAVGTDEALRAIEQAAQSGEFGPIKNVAILVWRIMPNGVVQYKCVGGACGMFTEEEQKRMACKQATGMAACVAEPWPEPKQQGSQYTATVSPFSGIGLGIDPGVDESEWDEPEPSEEPRDPRCPVCN